jgi:solute carrier family 10 (sodium/bile acid cotransporter), member 7
MVRFLARRWFLLVVITGVVVAWLQPEWLRWTRQAPPQAVMAVALFLAAWTLESRSLYQTLLRPFAALWALVISYGFLPALSFYVGGWLLPTETPDLRIGLMITASVPCTLASAVLWTRMAGGNEAAALLSTLLTTFLSWFATTAWLALSTGSQVNVNSAGMMRSLALILVVPVGVGQGLRAVPVLARTATRYKTPLGVISRLLIVVILLRAAVEVHDQAANETTRLTVADVLITLAVCLGTHLLALTAGFWSGRLLGLDRPRRIAVAFAGSQKTLPVSLYLFDVYFRSYPLAVVPIAFYHIGQLILDTFIADLMARPAPKTVDEALPSEEMLAGE